MARLFCFGLVLTLMLSLLAGCGCGKLVHQAQQAREAARLAQDIQKGKGQFKTDDGKTTVGFDKDKKTVVTQDEKGRKTVISGDKDNKGWSVSTGDEKFAVRTGESVISEQDLGMKFYPGAKVEGSTGGGKTSGAKAQTATVILKTSDAFDKVASFYKKEYGSVGKKTETSFVGVQMLNLTWEKGKSTRTITVTSNPGDKHTAILLASVSKG